MIVNSGGKKPKRLFRVYSWMTGKDEDVLITSRTFGKFLQEECFPDFTTQIYYDIVVLGLTDESQRPKCEVCGKENKFNGMVHGYSTNCSDVCHRKWKSEHMNDKMIRKGDKIPEETKNKIGKTIRAKDKEEIWNDEWRRKHSEHMKAFAQTEKGKEFYKMVGEICSKKNIERMINEENKPYHLNSKLYYRGTYISEVYDNSEFRYDSGWELTFIKYMEQKKLEISEFSRCNDVVFYTKEDGSTHRYLPDFYIKFKSGVEIIIEIKPHYLLEDEVVKLKSAAGKEYFNKKNIKYFIITEKDFLSGQNIKASFDILNYESKED